MIIIIKPPSAPETQLEDQSYVHLLATYSIFLPDIAFYAYCIVLWHMSYQVDIMVDQPRGY